MARTCYQGKHDFVKVFQSKLVEAETFNCVRDLPRLKKVPASAFDLICVESTMTSAFATLVEGDAEHHDSARQQSIGE